MRLQLARALALDGDPQLLLRFGYAPTRHRCRAARSRTCWWPRGRPAPKTGRGRPRPTYKEADMKALVYHGPGRRFWDDVPDPVIRDPEDALVRVDAVTIWGPTCTSSRVTCRRLNHPDPRPRSVGTVLDVGGGVRQIHAGDRVLVSCISSCGRCRYCREARYGQCLGGGGWILGHRIDGTQAEHVRVPFADTSVYHCRTPSATRRL